MLSKIKTNPQLRSLMRKAGILKALKKVQAKHIKAYEERFSKAMLSSIHEGDVVWDIGANVGFYTCKFAHAVGSSGQVVAFEPVKDIYLRMVAACKNEGLSNVLPKQFALGHCDEQFNIFATSDGDGTTNSLINKDIMGGVLVMVKQGDHLIADGLPAPTVIKIDVEAYEEEVIFGLRNYLQSGRLKLIFCEVHFEQLTMRGSMNAPRRIKSLLKDAGYVVRWIDASHFKATYNGTINKNI
jgi:FkbM family methyltransferase